MSRLVRTLRVRRGAPGREEGCLISATRTGAVRLVRTLRRAARRATSQS